VLPSPQLSDVVADIKALTISDPGLVSQLGPAFERYNEEQFTTAKLPGSSQQVIISSHNSLGGGRYYDVDSSSSFAFDHATQKASGVQSHVLEGAQADLVYVQPNARRHYDGRIFYMPGDHKGKR
jgi:capping protein (actin filament) muscle Z-line, alpha